MSILAGYILSNNAFAQSTTAANQLEQLKPIVGTERPSSLILMKVERLPGTLKGMNAEQGPDSIKVTNQPVGEEFYNVIRYTPGPLGKGGLAYKADLNYDLSDAKRVVLFAKGEKGGEKVSFVVGGNDLGQGAASQSSIFRNQKFDRITQDVVLDKVWKRYEVDLQGANLMSGVTYPFGFIVTKGQNQDAIAFSVRDITFDAGAPKNPLPLSANTTSLSTTSNITGTNNTQSLALTSPRLQGNDTAAGISLNGASDIGTTANNITAPVNTDNETQIASVSPQPVNTDNETQIASVSPQPVNTDNETQIASASPQILNSVTAKRSIAGANNFSNDSTEVQTSSPSTSVVSSPFSIPQTQNESSLSTSPMNSATNAASLLGGQSAIGSDTLEKTTMTYSLPSIGLPLQQVPSPDLGPPQPTVLNNNLLDTIITSAVDNSTGSNIQDGETASSSIILTFATTDESSISRYLCSIDNSQAFYCESPLIVNSNGLPGLVGNTPSHIFRVSTIDFAGNPDPTPAAFNWVATATPQQESVLPQTDVLPQTILPQTLLPQTILPQTLLPETILPQTLLPETILPQTLLPETIVPQTILPETIVPQTLLPQTLLPQTILPQTILPNAAVLPAPSVIAGLELSPSGPGVTDEPKIGAE
jgi:hypothetical protein